jgi:hypothetical protein
MAKVRLCVGVFFAAFSLVGCSMTSDVLVAPNGNYKLNEVRAPILGGINAAERAAWDRAKEICSKKGLAPRKVSGERRTILLNIDPTQYDLEFYCGKSEKDIDAEFEREFATIVSKRKPGNEGWFNRELARIAQKYYTLADYEIVFLKKMIVAGEDLDTGRITRAQYNAIHAELSYESDQRRKKEIDRNTPSWPIHVILN